MIETIKLYDEDAYATEFTARVVSSEETKSGWNVVLDRTLFFPEEGGQSPDSGVLAGLRVTDVQIRKGIITHTLERPDSESAGAADGTGRAAQSAAGPPILKVVRFFIGTSFWADIPFSSQIFKSLSKLSIKLSFTIYPSCSHGFNPSCQ